MGDITQSPRPRLRIAILECDEPIGRTKEKYQSYGNLFKNLLERGLEQLYASSFKPEQPAPELEITKFDVFQHELYPSLENVDAVLLTGSRYNSFDDEPWILKLVDFTRRVLTEQDRVRVVGICFGHQIVGRALGAAVGRAEKGWEVSVTKVELTERGREVFGLQEGEMAIHQMHRDVVYGYPEGVERLGRTGRCEVQAMYDRKRLITVQGHPEFDGDIVSELLDNRHERGVFDDDMYNEGLRTVRNHHDGLTISVAILRFLLDDFESS